MWEVMLALVAGPLRPAPQRRSTLGTAVSPSGTSK